MSHKKDKCDCPKCGSSDTHEVKFDPYKNAIEELKQEVKDETGHAGDKASVNNISNSWKQDKPEKKDVKRFKISHGLLDNEHDSSKTPCAGCGKKFAVLSRIEGNLNDSVCLECYGARFGAIEVSEIYKSLSEEVLDGWSVPIRDVRGFVDFNQLSVPQLVAEKKAIAEEIDNNDDRLYDEIKKEELDRIKHLSSKQKASYLKDEATIGLVYEDALKHVSHIIRERPYTQRIDDAQVDFDHYIDSITDENGYLDKQDAIDYASKKLDEIDRSNFMEGEGEALDKFKADISEIIFDTEGKRLKPCPSCYTNHLKYPLNSNALSRKDGETWICSECGTNEALQGIKRGDREDANAKLFQAFLDDVLPKEIPKDDPEKITDWLMVQYRSDEPDEKYMDFFEKTGGDMIEFKKVREDLQTASPDFIQDFRLRLLDVTTDRMNLIGGLPSKHKVTSGEVDKMADCPNCQEFSRKARYKEKGYFAKEFTAHLHDKHEKIFDDIGQKGIELDPIGILDKSKEKPVVQEAKSNDTVKKIDPRYKSFEEAREWALGQKIHSRQDWVNLTKTDDFPEYIPIHPETKYKPVFQEKGGLSYFCGYVQKVRRAPLTEDKVRQILETFEERWDFYAEYSTGMVTNWFDTQGLFSVKDPYVQDLLAKLTSWRLDPEGIEALRYWFRTGDYEKKFGRYKLQGKTEESKEDYLDRIPTQIQDITTISGLLERQMTTGVEKIMLNARMVVPDETDRAWYDQQVEFCVRNILSKLFDPELELQEYEKLKQEKPNGNPFHDEILKTALMEYELVKNINYDKNFYTFPNEPTLLQKYHAYKMRTKNCFFNMSGTGQKKTGASVIGAIACKCQNIIVIAPNNIVPQWVRNIRKFYSNAFVFSGKNLHQNFFVNAGKHIPKFHVINYDKFGRNNLAESFKQQIGSQKIDMIIFDEGQLARKRDDTDPSSNRDTRTNKRVNLEKLVEHLRNNNRKVKVCMLSATPIINSISEGKSLLEILTGTKYGFSTRNTPRNANKLHTEFIPFSIVYNKKPDLIEVGRDKPVIVDAFLPENLTEEETMLLNWMELEQIATKYRIPKILEILKNSTGKTVIYTDYVSGIVPQLREACINAGYKVGEFTGSDKSGMMEKTGLKDKEGNDEIYNRFVKGDLDVLIASRPFQVGIDEVQFVCNNLILNGLVWTYAEFEQIIGRVSRDGSNFDRVNIHVVMARINGYDYDLKIKYNRILKKRALGDCVRYGTLPDELDIPDTKGERLRALKAMIKNKESGFPEKEEIERKHALEAEAEIQSKIQDLNEKFAQVGIDGDEKHGN